jgi:hypothetical protein
VPIALVVKRYESDTYLFAAAMREGTTKTTFKLCNVTGKKPVKVFGEDQIITARGGHFEDVFGPWDVHLR